MADIYISQLNSEVIWPDVYPYLDFPGQCVLQTFTPTSTFRIYKLSIYASIFGTILIDFYNTSGGLPIGNPLVSTSLYGENFVWHETMSILPKIVFTAGITYAMIFRLSPSYPLWATIAKNTEGGLSGGNLYLSDDSGSSWTLQLGDLTFKITGITPEPIVPYYPTPSDDIISVPVDIMLTWANGSYTDAVDVYLNKVEFSATPITKVVDNQNVQSYQPPVDLELGKEYVWKVVAKNAYGETESNIWSFTTGSPIVITNVTELQAMNNNLSAAYTIANDIDATETSGWNDGAGFLPIGSTGSPFTGILFGNGFIINNLTVNRPTTQYVGGLFSVLSTQSYIENVNLINVSVNGRQYVGGFAGYMTSCNCAGCSVSGTVLQTGTTYRYVGGFVGYLTGASHIYNCISDVDVTAQSTAVANYIGGFLGFGGGTATIDKCYSSGNVILTGATGGVYAGGFAGNVPLSITNCYATGNVTVNTSFGYAAGFVTIVDSGDTVINCYSIGAVVGKYTGGFCKTKTGTITNCYYDSTTSGQSDTGKGEPKTTGQMRQEVTFVDWDFNTPVWYIVEGTSYPDFTPDLPGKPINPTPTHLATGIKLSWPTLTWESGS